MISKVFSIRDTKAEAFLPPFMAPATGHALRSFMDACSDPNSTFYKHPDDFMLYEIATFDDSTAVYESLSPVKLVNYASDLIKKDIANDDKK